jgi:hypothetical protein
MYKCSKCGRGVLVVVDGKPLPKPIRACDCNATIVASLSSVIEGKGGLKQNTTK